MLLWCHTTFRDNPCTVQVPLYIGACTVHWKCSQGYLYLLQNQGIWWSFVFGVLLNPEQHKRVLSKQYLWVLSKYSLLATIRLQKKTGLCIQLWHRTLRRRFISLSSPLEVLWERHSETLWRKRKSHGLNELWLFSFSRTKITNHFRSTIYRQSFRRICIRNMIRDKRAETDLRSRAEMNKDRQDSWNGFSIDPSANAGAAS